MLAWPAAVRRCLGILIASWRARDEWASRRAGGIELELVLPRTRVPGAKGPEHTHQVSRLAKTGSCLEVKRGTMAKRSDGSSPGDGR